MNTNEEILKVKEINLTLMKRLDELEARIKSLEEDKADAGIILDGVSIGYQEAIEQELLKRGR